MRRREFIGILGCAAAGWPLAADAQQLERIRRVGVLMNRAAKNQEGQDRVAAFRQGMQDRGWQIGRDLEIEIRWGEDDADLERKAAAELIAVSPDVVLASGTMSVAAFQNAGASLPIVFSAVADPIGAGIIDDLTRPGGNTTGFMIYEYSLGAKWIELLKQIAPNVSRVAIVRNAANPAGVALYSALHTACQSLGLEPHSINVRNPAELDHLMAAFARTPNGGLAVTQTASLFRDAIVEMAARYKLPAVYGTTYDVAAGGLIAYAPDMVAQVREAAAYVDRILKGEKPGDLPVQAPIKYQLSINLKTAKALGLQVPPSLLARADGVIE